MEVIMPGGVQLTMDCEDMFKEITKKLYGEEGVIEFPLVTESHRNGHHQSQSHQEVRTANQDYDSDGAALKPEEHITAYGLAALMQNGFPPPGILNANFMPRTNPNAEDKWTSSEETVQWCSSKVASYNPAQKLFKCADCECVGFLSRIAEHWLGTHSNARVFQCPHCSYASTWARCVRAHLSREHDIPDDHNTEALFKNNPALDEITKYLQRLKSKVDGQRPKSPSQQSANNPNNQNGNSSGSSSNGGTNVGDANCGTKRYGCPVCPYATDRRDLFTRHENIHREEKPFECYVCTKQFNRADHVKKHFLRMHREHPYDLNRIRRAVSKPSTNFYIKQQQQQQQQTNETATIVDNSAAVSLQNAEFVRRVTAAAAATPTIVSAPTQIKIEHHQVKTEPVVVSRTGNNTVAVPNSVNAKKRGDKRYSCCYCSWSGVDNWCLKRHLNTHLKPFVCSLCDYKAARAERLSTHVNKVHNKKQCNKCTFLADDHPQLIAHQQQQHQMETRNIKVPTTLLRTAAVASYSSSAAAAAAAVGGTVAVAPATFGGSQSVAPLKKRPKGAARLFRYMEASDGSDDDYYGTQHIYNGTL